MSTFEVEPVNSGELVDVSSEDSLIVHNDRSDDQDINATNTFAIGHDASLDLLGALGGAQVEREHIYLRDHAVESLAFRASGSLRERY